MATASRPADPHPGSNTFGHERRRARRHSVHRSVYASVSGSSQAAPTNLSEILDISEVGTCIQFAAPMEMERLLPLCLDLSPLGARLYVVGHVVWSGPSGKTGVRFPDISEGPRRRLLEWMQADIAAAPPAASSDSVDQSLPQSASTEATQSAAWEEIERELAGCGSDVEAALQLIAQWALSLNSASGAAIALLSADSSQMVCRARAGAVSPGIGARLESGSGFSAECVRSSQTITCEDSEHDPRVDRNSCRALGIRSIVATPVMRDGQVIGILEIFSAQPEAFRKSAAATLERLAAFITQIAQKSTPVSVAPPASASESTANTPLQTASASGSDAATSAESQRIEPQFETLDSPAASSARKAVLLSTGIVCLIIIIWMLAPAIAKLSSTPAANDSSAVQADSAPEDFVLTSISDLTARANQGDAQAQYALGMRYASGADVALDYRAAYQWFLLAAEQGNIRAEGKVAAAFWEGKGAPQDYSKAYFWAILAQAGGDEISKQIVMSSAARLSPVQVATEQKEADQWLHKHHIGRTTP